MAAAGGPVPPVLKPIQPLITIGKQLENKEPVVSFYGMFRMGCILVVY